MFGYIAVKNIIELSFEYHFMNEAPRGELVQCPVPRFLPEQCSPMSCILFLFDTKTFPISFSHTGFLTFNDSTLKCTKQDRGRIDA